MTIKLASPGKSVRVLQPIKMRARSVSEICGDLAELFEGGFEVFDDFLGEHTGVGEVIRFFEAIASEPANIQVGFPALSSEVQKFRMSSLLSQTSAHSRMARVNTLLKNVLPCFDRLSRNGN